MKKLFISLLLMAGAAVAATQNMQKTPEDAEGAPKVIMVKGITKAPTLHKKNKINKKIKKKHKRKKTKRK